MLNTGGIELSDVLAKRRGQAGVRAGAAILLMFNNGPMLGWPVVSSLAGLYCALQAVEFFVFRKERQTRRAGGVALAVLGQIDIQGFRRG
jgi:hypothetical protein